MRILFAILSLIFLVSCANTADTVGNESLNGDYRLTGIRGSSFSSDDITLTFKPIGNTLTGTTGCNKFSANFHQEGTEVYFTTPISTRKHCEGKMRTEQRILSSIEEISKFRQQGDEFIFLSEGNKPLITLTKIN